jgi:hypothetical protein
MHLVSFRMGRAAGETGAPHDYEFDRSLCGYWCDRRLELMGVVDLARSA